MPLNKLENFIKNTDGRTLYVNPADLNATDSITNQGTSLTEPFRTIQRALIEAARFSYVRGNDNDLIEKTTIVLYPGEHPIDNRPGYGIKVIDGNPVAKKPDGSLVDPFSSFNLTDDSNFDIESPNNVLSRFNSIYGGVIVPRGTSIVGMDLRKTKIRPLYVPNPTDPAVPDSAIFRITGTCYFWQFTIFDGLETGLVFTDNKDFSENNRSVPTFSHHKLTAFEYADGVNIAIAEGFELTDLAMYYSKLTNAYNEASGRPVDEKYPADPEGFAPMRPEFEIVGAFATDPVNITRIISGDGFTPDAVITVDTAVPHDLSVGTPIKIRGVSVSDYNISTKVANVLGTQRFTYSLSFVRPNLPAEPSVSSATVTVETDTVTGASPYIFNCSMRSVWGINGMNADGAKATGFRSMVVAQFTAISLQKDDRAFVKYNQPARRYDGINYTTVRGAELSAESSSTNTAQVYHLDPGAVYRPEWDTTHIKMANDAVIQIVSVFAIGFNQHFGALNGADASITNSNSNFGQFALLSEGFKNDAFSKDDQGFITSIITPNNAFNSETNQIEVVDYVNIDFDLTRSVAINNQLYLQGYKNSEDLPPAVTQGFRIGANYEERLIQPITGQGTPPEATVEMVNNVIDATNNVAVGDSVGRKVYNVLSGPVNSVLTLPAHGLLQGEKIRIFSADADLPENVESATLYYCNVVDAENIRLATSESNAVNSIFLNIYGGSKLRIESRVNDKNSGDPGHPLQYDTTNSNWFVHTNRNSEIFQYITTGDGSPGREGSGDGADFVTVFNRKADNRNLDDKLYRLRYVIPKETTNAKPPTPGYVVQDSSTTGVRNNDDFTLTEIGINDYGYDRNTRFIVNCQVIQNRVEVRSEKPHQLSVGDKIEMVNVTSLDNPAGTSIRGYNGEFRVVRVRDARNFDYSLTDVNGFTRNPNGPSTNDTDDRNILLPRFIRKDNENNAFVYRIEEIAAFQEGIRDGIYHLFCVNGANKVTETFTERAYNQPIEDLYPQLDIDNLRQNPPATTTYAARAPLGRTFIDEQQNSITRETVDRIYRSYNRGIVVDSTVVNVSAASTISLQVTLDREHTFNALYSYSTLNGSSGYPQDGVFYNIRLFSNLNSYWKGASATVTVVSGSVSDVVISDPGSGYLPGETLTLSTVDLPGGSATITIEAGDIQDNRNTIVQMTGGGSESPTFYALLESVAPDDSKVFTIVCDAENFVTEGMYAYPADSATEIASYTFNGVESFFTSENDAGIGLQRGNSFVAFDSNAKYIGKYYVKGQPTTTTMESVTLEDLGDVKWIGKAGLEDNDAPTGRLGENIGIRGTEEFDLGTFFLEDSAKTSDLEIQVRSKDGGSAGTIADKLFLGRYIKIGNEILRVADSEVTGPSQNIVQVIRGALGTDIARHEANAKIRAIEPQAIELRRPSILRASGHTFEYLGYGPGNYSTSLPQLQVRQLPDDEVYLVQSQELSCGQVVYTGMSDNGDFYIGNTKYSATSGTQTTFDVPIPTVAGQEGSSNSVVFDEVIINRRLFVAGGDTNEILSQFDGPVKFTQSVTIQNRLSVSETASLFDAVINDPKNSTAPTNGALVVRGGVGIGRDLYVGGKINVKDLEIDNNLDVGNDATIGNDLDVGNDLRVDEDVSIGGNINLDSSSAIIYSNNYYAVNGNSSMTLFPNQGSGSITIGSGGSRDVRFQTDKPGVGEGGDDVNSATAGVVVDGGMVVRDIMIAKEFRGDGLGGGPGTILMWGGNISTPPKNFLICNGASVSTSSYPKLFAAIGYTFGGSGGSFRLPNMTNRFIVGSGGSYSTGNTGGANTVAITRAQMASHSHSTDNASTSHAHPGSTADTGTARVPHDHTLSIDNGGNHEHNTFQTTGGNHSHQPNTITSSGAHGHQSYDLTSGRHSHPAANGGDGGNHGHNAGNAAPGGAHNHEYDTASGREQARDGGQDGYWRRNGSGNTNSKGEHSHRVTVASQGSEHQHPVSVPNQGSNHTHRITIPSTSSGHTHPYSIPSNQSPHTHSINTPSSGSGHEHTGSVQSSNAGNHEHPASVSVATVSQSHQHPIGVTGSDQAHENRPPYFALAYIIQYK